MPIDTQHPLRKVAILVASLDEEWAARVLSDLPEEIAGEVYKVVEQLQAIDPTEQQDIVKEFRRSMAAELVPGPAMDEQPLDTGVELDASLLARLESEPTETIERPNIYSQSRRSHGPLNTLTEAEPDVIAKLLMKEHSQTIAVVLSRFEHHQAANILSQLPVDLQAEVLSRLTELDTADPQTLQVVESQLVEWIQQQQQQKTRMAVGVELVQRILDSSPHKQRQTVLTSIKRLKPELAGQLQHDCQPPMDNSLGIDRTKDEEDAAKRAQRPEILYSAQPMTEAIPEQILPQAPLSQPISADPMADLERAGDQALLTVLSQADRQTVMLALAGASETLLKRILRGLPRSQAKSFRKQLRMIGPTRLSDMLSAQQELAHQIQLLVS